MRLIDADDLITEILTHDLICDDKEVDKIILNAPTVRAIPIEWIKDRIKKAVAFTHSKAEGNIIDNGCVVTIVSASFTAQVLVNLLEAWEREHEENI